MAADLTDRTVFPPEHAELLRELEQFLEAVPVAELKSPDGETTELPMEVYGVLREVVEAMSRGQAITVAPHDQALTTQEAADLLGISRPTFIKLLERGEIEYTQPGRHRRVLLRDVLAYQRRSRERTADALQELTDVSEESGLYSDEVSETRLRR